MDTEINTTPATMHPPNHATISNEAQLLLFHQVDRELYKVLTIELHRDPAQSMFVVALWNWMERVGFWGLITAILSMANVLIDEVAEETVVCIRCLKGIVPLCDMDGIGLPRMQVLIRRQVSLRFFHDHREIAIEGVHQIVKDVYAKVFTNVMMEAVFRAPPSEPQNEAMHDDGVHPPSDGSSGVQISVASFRVPSDERSLFVTFSRGYQVFEWEQKGLFTALYGDCIDYIAMKEGKRGGQGMYARVVFHDTWTVNTILGGATNIKFSINGKRVWARRFEPKRGLTERHYTLDYHHCGESSYGSGDIGHLV